MYREENETAEKPVESIASEHQRTCPNESHASCGMAATLMNSNSTSGIWGISFHDLEDLVLHEVTLQEEDGCYTLGMDS